MTVFAHIVYKKGKLNKLVKTVVLNRILPTAHVLVFHNKFSMALIADESLIYHGYSIYLITVNSKGQMSNDCTAI